MGRQSYSRQQPSTVLARKSVTGTEFGKTGGFLPNGGYGHPKRRAGRSCGAAIPLLVSDSRMLQLLQTSSEDYVMIKTNAAVGRMLARSQQGVACCSPHITVDRLDATSSRCREGSHGSDRSEIR
jgi:hypothetical protein